MENHQTDILKFHSFVLNRCYFVLPDDVAALHDLSLVDDKGRGQPDDVSVGGLRQQPPGPSASGTPTQQQ